ncbi:MAG: tetratricopeptide repeat protein [Candidatus Eisenbacteria bacterium]
MKATRSRRARWAAGALLGGAILVLAGAGCFSFGAPKPAQIRDGETEQGFRLLREEKWSFAMGAFRKALEADPNHAPARYGLGRVFTETGYVEGAEAEYRRAAELDPGYGEAYLGLAALLYENGRYGEAEANVLRAQKNGAGGSPQALFLLGLFAERRGAPYEAETDFRASLEAAPSDAGTRLALVDLLMKLERFDDALFELDRERFPRGEEDEVRIRMADCRRRLGQDLEAERLYRQHAQVFPLSPEPLWGLAVLSLRRGDAEGARDHIASLAAILDPAEGAVLTGLAAALESPDPFFVFLGRCRDAREGASESFRARLDDMIRELVRDYE